MAENNYDPKTAEPKWQKYWKENGIYAFKPKKGQKIFSIDTPPPTVSGAMHIGHSFSYSQGDFIARFRRMRGDAVFYPWGTDDNGLPTERLVEKLKKVKSVKMPRSEFIGLCRMTLAEITPDFTKDWKDIAISADFTHPYSTIDEHSIRESQKSFIELYKKGYVYRQDTPVSWCTMCQTAIAQAEFENVDLPSTFNDIAFHVDGKEVIIATTRPELISSCVALLYHPTDKRYANFAGKKASIPLFGREVPVLSDEKVDPEKGSGLLMCCTFGDMTDVMWWRKFELPLVVSIEKNGLMNENAGKYKGLSIKDARKQILADLEAAGLLKAKKPITHPVNVHDKCGTEVEILKTLQWFVKILEHKQKLLAVADKINWYPAFMKHRYINWVENLNWDWCISRQRHFGVPFPVWYDDEGKVILADLSQLPVDTVKDKPLRVVGECTPEMDVMDTWATSSLTPQIALGLPTAKSHVKEMFPQNVRLQAHDIIRTWAFYTIVKSLYQTGSIPWKDIVISGHALDPHGKKMSKSKGNVVDPKEVLAKYNADALRFWAAGSKLGEDLAFLDKELVTGHKTITKLWNASRFGLMHLEGFDPRKAKMSFADLEIADKWFLAKLMRTVKVSTDEFEQYEYARTRLESEKFFWHTLCDNYLEFVKDRMYGTDADSKLKAQFALYHGILYTLKLFAPIMPHITEEVYHLGFAAHEGFKSIHLSTWPSFDDSWLDEEAEKAGDLLCDVVSATRKFKSSQGKSLKTPLSKLTYHCEDSKIELMFKGVEQDIIRIGLVGSIEKSEKPCSQVLSSGLSLDLVF